MFFPCRMYELSYTPYLKNGTWVLIVLIWSVLLFKSTPTVYASSKWLQRRHIIIVASSPLTGRHPWFLGILVPGTLFSSLCSPIAKHFSQ